MSTVDSGKFFEQLRDRVNNVRAAEGAGESAVTGSAASYRAALDHRRTRDELGSLVAAYPEEFVGLVVLLAERVEYLTERLDNAGVV